MLESRRASSRSRWASSRAFSYSPRERTLVARRAQIAEVEAAGELRLEIVRARELQLHLRDLEIGRDARLRQLSQREDEREQLHSAKYPLRAFAIVTPARRG
jgi:hypothetical protein